MPLDFYRCEVCGELYRTDRQDPRNHCEVDEDETEQDERDEQGDEN
jgi:rubredoxin